MLKIIKTEFTDYFRSEISVTIRLDKEGFDRLVKSYGQFHGAILDGGEQDCLHLLKNIIKETEKVCVEGGSDVKRRND